MPGKPSALPCQQSLKPWQEAYSAVQTAWQSCRRGHASSAPRLAKSRLLYKVCTRFQADLFQQTPASLVSAQTTYMHELLDVVAEESGNSRPVCRHKHLDVLMRLKLCLRC